MTSTFKIVAAGAALTALMGAPEAKAQETRICMLHGTAPFCAGNCPAGWQYKGHRKANCLTGRKALCCRPPGWKPRRVPVPKGILRL